MCWHVKFVRAFKKECWMHANINFFQSAFWLLKMRKGFELFTPEWSCSEQPFDFHVIGQHVFTLQQKKLFCVRCRSDLHAELLLSYTANVANSRSPDFTESNGAFVRNLHLDSDISPSKCINMKVSNFPATSFLFLLLSLFLAYPLFLPLFVALSFLSFFDLLTLLYIIYLIPFILPPFTTSCPSIPPSSPFLADLTTCKRPKLSKLLIISGLSLKMKHCFAAWCWYFKSFEFFFLLCSAS